MLENSLNSEPLGLSTVGRFTSAKVAVYGAILSASAARSLPLVFDGVESRGVIPEPFDVVNHAGNMSVSAAIIGHITYTANRKTHSEGEVAMTSQELRSHRRVTAGFCGFIAVAANIFAEKVGYGSSSTPDVLDFAYGLLGAYAGYSVTKPTQIQPDKVQEIIDNPGSHSKDITAVRDAYEKRGRKVITSQEKEALARQQRITEEKAYETIRDSASTTFPQTDITRQNKPTKSTNQKRKQQTQARKKNRRK